jgi:hypothetical protein
MVARPVTELSITWPSMPERHDYQAAEDYRRLVLTPKHADHAVHELRHAKHTRAWKAKDILRAAQLQDESAEVVEASLAGS